MINKKIEPYYNIAISIFLGILVVLILHNFYDYPRTIIVNSDKQNVTLKKSCHDINVTFQEF
jgi:hypothetical protein